MLDNIGMRASKSTIGYIQSENPENMNGPELFYI